MLWLLFTALFHSATKALELESRIVNGIPIQASTYPWMVSLRSVSKYQAYTWRGDTNTSSIEFCGGSLINLSPPIVLTAAQCVNWFEYNATEGQFVETYDNVNKTYPIYLYADINRTHAMDETGEPYQSLQITDESMVHIHEKYNASTLQNGYDIALIVFDDGQTVSGFSESDIPSLGESLGDDEECCTDGDELDVLGYGANVTGWSAGYYSNPLQRTKTLEYTTVRYVKMRECKSIIGDYHDALFYYYHVIYSTEFAHDGFVCAVGNNTDFCWSDYGGPLFNESDGEIQILGVASFLINECNTWIPYSWTKLPSVYTSVGHFVGWIEEIIDEVVTTMSPTSEPTFDITDVITNDVEESDSAHSGSISFSLIVALFGVLYMQIL